jgi:hypothetical protein
MPGDPPWLGSGESGFLAVPEGIHGEDEIVGLAVADDTGIAHLSAGFGLSLRVGKRNRVG